MYDRGFWTYTQFCAHLEFIKGRKKITVRGRECQTPGLKIETFPVKNLMIVIIDGAYAGVIYQNPNKKRYDYVCRKFEKLIYGEDNLSKAK